MTEEGVRGMGDHEITMYGPNLLTYLKDHITFTDRMPSFVKEEDVFLKLDNYEPWEKDAFRISFPAQLYFFNKDGLEKLSKEYTEKTGKGFYTTWLAPGGRYIETVWFNGESFDLVSMAGECPTNTWCDRQDIYDLYDNWIDFIQSAATTLKIVTGMHDGIYNGVDIMTAVEATNYALRGMISKRIRDLLRVEGCRIDGAVSSVLSYLDYKLQRKWAGEKTVGSNPWHIEKCVKDYVAGTLTSVTLNGLPGHLKLAENKMMPIAGYDKGQESLGIHFVKSKPYQYVISFVDENCTDDDLPPIDPVEAEEEETGEFKQMTIDDLMTAVPTDEYGNEYL